MGGINEFISSIDNKKNIIMETGRESNKHHVAHKIYEKIYKDERKKAAELTKCLQEDVNSWLSKNTSYVNLWTA